VAAAPAAAPAASAPAGIRHPIEPDAAASAVAESADAFVLRTLQELFGPTTVATLLQTDGFVARAVATVDNLGRAHAPPQRWPVTPPLGRFSIDAANAGRYDSAVALATVVDAKRLAQAYRALYPQFQQSYQQLGYPQGYFNDRLVEVIDLMLATPEPAAPPAVRLTDVKGPLASNRPWVRYEFVDPRLEALPAGSKMLLRMGPANARKIKAQLRALRAEIARPN
jgi:hypothetical protein